MFKLQSELIRIIHPFFDIWLHARLSHFVASMGTGSRFIELSLRCITSDCIHEYLPCDLQVGPEKYDSIRYAFNSFDPEQWGVCCKYWQMFLIDLTYSHSLFIREAQALEMLLLIPPTSKLWDPCSWVWIRSIVTHNNPNLIKNCGACITTRIHGSLSTMLSDTFWISSRKIKEKSVPQANRGDAESFDAPSTLSHSTHHHHNVDDFSCWKTHSTAWSYPMSQGLDKRALEHYCWPQRCSNCLFLFYWVFIIRQAKLECTVS